MADKYPDGFPWRKTIDNNFLDNLNLREINLIAFPDWSQQEVSKIQETLGELLKLIQLHPETSKIALLLYAPATLEEQANTILWEFLVNYIDESVADTDLPEVAIVSEMSSAQWKSLLSMLAGYIPIESEDSEGVLQLVKEQIPLILLNQNP